MILLKAYYHRFFFWLQYSFVRTLCRNTKTYRKFPIVDRDVLYYPGANGRNFKRSIICGQPQKPEAIPQLSRNFRNGILSRLLRNIPAVFPAVFPQFFRNFRKLHCAKSAQFSVLFSLIINAKLRNFIFCTVLLELASANCKL